MITISNQIKAILALRVHPVMLTGYRGGAFSPGEDKLYAYTLVKLSDVNYTDFEHLPAINSYSTSDYDFEKGKKYLPDGSYQLKTITEMVEQGIYKYLSLTYVGCYFTQQWYILPSLHFYGDQLDEGTIQQRLDAPQDKPVYWEQDLFKPKKPFTDNGREIREVQFEEFKDIPYLAAILLQEKKEKVNQAYVNYFNEEMIKPFFERLRITDPLKYKLFCELSHNFTAIFPQHKHYTLFCCLHQDAAEKWHLGYFLYRDVKYYRWNYFNPKSYDYVFYYGDEIIDDLKQISHWDYHVFLSSSCTMDDQNFWDKYVFAQKDDKYLYLEEV